MAKSRVLVIDDDADICSSIKEYLEELGPDQPVIQVDTETNFDFGLELLDERRYDVVILDVRIQADGGEDRDAGIRLLNTLKSTRFIPIVFYTGLPNLVFDLQMPPLIHVVRKELGPQSDGVLGVLQAVFSSSLPRINQALTSQVQAIQRDYMWDFVSRHWNEINAGERDHSLFYLVARRLALSLSALDINRLVSNIDPQAQTFTDGSASDSVPPERFYIMPPLGNSTMAGDIYQELIDEKNRTAETDEWKYVGETHKWARFWIVLTPSCDLVEDRIKAERVLFAKCHFLEGFDEYRGWRSAATETKRKAIEQLLKNRPKDRQEGRYFYMPGVFDIPHLLVDFQEVVAVPYAQLRNWKRLASLDSPYAEALLSTFARYFGRLGTPDLDIRLTLSRLSALPLFSNETDKKE